MNVFFFNQKTAYEMRISDWSSDVCSSDLDTHDETPVICGADWGERVSLRGLPARRTRLMRGTRRRLHRSRRIVVRRTRGRLWRRGCRLHWSRPPWPVSSRDRPCIGCKKSEEHTSELTSLMRISYAVFSLKRKNK